MKKFLGKSLIIIVSAILLGTLLLGLAYTIPVSRIDPRVERAAHIFEQEGVYPQASKFALSTMDNLTDSIMLLEAAFPRIEGPLKSAMMAPRYTYGNWIPNESLYHCYSEGTYDCRVEDYPNYWHGYLSLLKPLLSIMEYSSIIILNGLLQLLITGALCVILWKKDMKLYIAAYLLGILLLRPLAIIKCLQYSSCFYIMSGASIAVLLSDKAKKPELMRLYIFLITGICTAYFDFLTYTMVTIGVPAIFYLNMVKTQKPAEAVKKLILAISAWLYGYSFMWLGKFAIGSLITGRNLFAATESHVSRWVSSGPQFSIGYVFYNNMRDFSLTPVMPAALLYALAVTVKIIKDRAFLKGKKEFMLHILFSYSLAAVIPFIYYMIMLNPSGVHYNLFANKALLVTALSGLSMLCKIRSLQLDNKICS